MTDAIPGTCLCGAVRFAIEPPYRWFGHCHCSMCRKHQGSLFATGLGVPSEGFRWAAGRGARLSYRATGAFERTSCLTCGAPTPSASHIPDVWHVPAGLVEDVPGYRPRTHIFLSSKSSQVIVDDDLPTYSAYPPSIELPIVLRPTPIVSVDGTIAGSCLCAAVTYEAKGPIAGIAHCHCSLCRRSTGAAYASWLTTSRATFRWHSGRALIRAYSHTQTTYAIRFCSACGGRLPAPRRDGRSFRLPAGSLDTTLAALPAVHICTRYKTPWSVLPKNAVQCAENPTDLELQTLWAGASRS